MRSIFHIMSFEFTEDLSPLREQVPLRCSTRKFRDESVPSEYLEKAKKLAEEVNTLSELCKFHIIEEPKNILTPMFVKAFKNCRCIVAVEAPGEKSTL